MILWLRRSMRRGLAIKWRMACIEWQIRRTERHRRKAWEEHECFHDFGLAEWEEDGFFHDFGLAEQASKEYTQWGMLGLQIRFLNRDLAALRETLDAKR